MLGAIRVVAGRIMSIIPAASRSYFGKGGTAKKVVGQLISKARKGSSLLVTKTSRGAAALSGRLASTKAGKFWNSLSPETQGFIKWIGADYLISGIVGMFSDDSAAENGVDVTSADDHAVGIVAANGHLDMINRFDAFARSENVQVTSTGTMEVHELIADAIGSGVIIAKGEVTGRMASRMNTLTDEQRVYALANLHAVAKLIANSSEFPSLMLLLSRQMACSNMINAAPTKGFDEIMSRPNTFKHEADQNALAYNLLFTGLYDSIANSGAKDYFDQASTVWDLGDLIKRDLDTTQKAEFLVSKLATDDITGYSGTWWDRFKTDADGKDDESAAMDIIAANGVISDRYVDEIMRSI